jgi:hypothetical protein
LPSLAPPAVDSNDFEESSARGTIATVTGNPRNLALQEPQQVFRPFLVTLASDAA